MQIQQTYGLHFFCANLEADLLAPPRCASCWEAALEKTDERSSQVFHNVFLYRWQDQRERPLVKSSLSATFGDTLAANAASIAAATVGESSPRFGH